MARLLKVLPPTLPHSAAALSALQWKRPPVETPVTLTLSTKPGALIWGGTRFLAPLLLPGSCEIQRAGPPVATALLAPPPPAPLPPPPLRATCTCILVSGLLAGTDRLAYVCLDPTA